MDRAHQARGGAVFIKLMKLNAFAAIAAQQNGEKEAWELWHHMANAAQTPPFSVFGKRGETQDAPAASSASGSSAPPPPPPPPPAVPEYRGPEPTVPPQKFMKSNKLPSGDGGPAPAPGTRIRPSRTPDAASGAHISAVPTSSPALTSAPAASSRASAPATGSGASSSEEKYHWQVRKGKRGKQKWGWVDADLDQHLEAAYQMGLGETTFDIDGWKYYYDLVEMMQTSPSADGTERQIRRWRYEDNSAQD